MMNGTKPRSAQRSATQPQALRVLKMNVKPGRLIVDLALHPTAPKETSAALIARVLTLCPTIGQHSCINEQHLDAGCFGAVMNCTSLPHLLEHMVVDLQVQQALGRACEEGTQDEQLAQRIPDTALVGSTEWLDEAAGLVRVSVSYFDDLIALRSFKIALEFLNKCAAVIAMKE